MRRYRLAVLRTGTLGARLRGIAPAFADGWVSPPELHGTPYVLNVWASWCVPCREEAPRLVRSWRHYPNLRDPTSRTSRRYGATGVPETFFIGAAGEIVAHVIGVVTPEQMVSGLASAENGRPRAARQGVP